MTLREVVAQYGDRTLIDISGLLTDAVLAAEARDWTDLIYEIELLRQAVSVLREAVAGWFE